jgi:hypothetical protein
MAFLRREFGNGSHLAYDRNSICLDIKSTEEESILEGKSITSSISFISDDDERAIGYLGRDPNSLEFHLFRERE